jgi:TonB family protein
MPDSAPTPEQTPDQPSPLLASTKSEIELPETTPTPTPKFLPNPTPLIKAPARPSPRPPKKPSPKPTPRPTPKPTPKPKPKKTVIAKASPRPTPELKPPPSKSDDDQEIESRAPPKDLAGTDRSADNESGDKAGGNGGGTNGSGGGAGRGNGTAKTSEIASYGRMLHDRLYSAWTQPTTTVSSSAKISTLVRLRIEKDGRVSDFQVVRPSGNVAVDESVAAIGKRVSQVDPLPAALRSDGHYDVKINFELNSD